MTETTRYLWGWALSLGVSMTSACSDDDPGGLDVGSGEFCAEVSSWDADLAKLEMDVLRLVNEAREQGRDCGVMGKFGRVPPLSMEPRLRCAARVHSKYMAERGEVDHVQSENGGGPFERIQASGYDFSVAGENIAAGQPTPEQAVQSWLDSDSHCSNIMSPDFVHLGVGIALGDGRPFGTAEAPYYTQVFGSER